MVFSYLPISISIGFALSLTLREKGYSKKGWKRKEKTGREGIFLSLMAGKFFEPTKPQPYELE